MNGYKSKHVSMPGEMYDRLHAIAARLGCPVSKLIQVALAERLPQWEAEAGSFQIDRRKTFEDMVCERLKARGIGKPLAELLGIAAPFVARD